MDSSLILIKDQYEKNVNHYYKNNGARNEMEIQNSRYYHPNSLDIIPQFYSCVKYGIVHRNCRDFDVAMNVLRLTDGDMDVISYPIDYDESAFNWRLFAFIPAL